ncbi:hypothetical protein KKA14_05040 [bacterium]|nr:hypothetical protein [bacterium]
MTNQYNYQGKCHCGNIHYSFKTSIPAPDFRVRQCSCSFCQKHGNRYISDPNGTLEYVIDQAQKLRRYRFGTKTADFFVCEECGVVPFVTCEIKNQTFAVLNINTLDEIGEFSTETGLADYSEELVEQRLERRKKNWIGTVTCK